MRGAGLVPGTSHRAARLHSPYWWLRCAVGPTNDTNRAVVAYRKFLEWDITEAPVATRTADRVLNPVLGKSLVVYAAKAGGSVIRLPEVEGVLSTDQLAATVDAIAADQLASGLILWYPGGHSDPWNHVEAAMALTVGGRCAEAERAYEWLIAHQLENGAWHNYYLADGDRGSQARHERVRLCGGGRVASLPHHV